MITVKSCQYLDTERALESVHIKQTEFRENGMGFFSQEQNKLSVIMRHLY